MQRRKFILPVLLLACFLGTIGLAQRGPRNPAAEFNFTPREMEDGSETFDTLIRGDNGLFIYGCIRKPPGKGPFPGIILIHGGLGANLAGTRNTALKSTPADALVARGYAVLGTDYRAGDWITEYQDIISAYEFFKQLPYIRSDAIAIMGGSHGGKLTLDAISRIQPQAAIPCSGLYDLAKLYEHCLTSEYHQFRMSKGGGAAGVFIDEITEQLGGTPTEVPGKYSEHSGISRLSYIKSPVFVVHGEQDASVPVSFGRELVAALQKQGATVEAYFAEKGPHGFYWGASAQGEFGVRYEPKENEVFLDRLLAFLDKYLKKTN